MESSTKKEGEVESRMNRRMKEKGTGIAGGTESRGREARGRGRGTEDTRFTGPYSVRGEFTQSKPEMSLLGRYLLRDLCIPNEFPNYVEVMVRKR